MNVKTISILVGTFAAGVAAGVVAEKFIFEKKLTAAADEAIGRTCEELRQERRRERAEYDARVAAEKEVAEQETFEEALDGDIARMERHFQAPVVEDEEVVVEPQSEHISDMEYENNLAYQDDFGTSEECTLYLDDEHRFISLDVNAAREEDTIIDWDLFADGRFIQSNDNILDPDTIVHEIEELEELFGSDIDLFYRHHRQRPAVIKDLNEGTVHRINWYDMDYDRAREGAIAKAEQEEEDAS